MYPLEKLQEQRVDAVIQVGGKVDELVSDPEYVDMVNSLPGRVPMVITGKLDGTECYQVKLDVMKAMDLLMVHLLELGHREIAVTGGQRAYYPLLKSYSAINRY